MKRQVKTKKAPHAEAQGLKVRLVLPIVMIIIIGAMVRGFSIWKVGVVDLGAGSAGRNVVAVLERTPDLTVRRYPDVRAMSTAIARGELSTGVVLPAGMEQSQRAGRSVDIGVVLESANTSMRAAATAVAAIVQAEGARVQAGAIGPAVGIAFGMLGGCMWPLAIVSPLMREIGHATPHAWAVDAWTALLSRGRTVATILPELAVLAGFAAAFLVLAAWRLRQTLRVRAT